MVFLSEEATETDVLEVAPFGREGVETPSNIFLRLRQVSAKRMASCSITARSFISWLIFLLSFSINTKFLCNPSFVVVVNYHQQHGQRKGVCKVRWPGVLKAHNTYDIAYNCNDEHEEQNQYRML